MEDEFIVLDMKVVDEKIKNKANKVKLKSNLLSAIAYWNKQVKYAKNVGE